MFVRGTDLEVTPIHYDKLSEDVSYGTLAEAATATDAVSFDSPSSTNQEPTPSVHNELTELVVPGEEQASAAADSDGNLRISESSTRSKVIYFLLAVAFFVSGCAYSLSAPFFPREARKKGVSSTTVGIIFGCYEIVSFFAALVFGHFVSQIGAKTLCASGSCVAGASSVAYGFLFKAPNGSAFTAAAFIFRISEALGIIAFVTASFAIICSEFEKNVASVLGTLQSCYGIGLMVGPTLGGALYEAGGFGLPFWVIGGVCLVDGLVVFIFLPPAENRVLADHHGNLLTLLQSPLVWIAVMLLFLGALSVSFLEPTLSLHLAHFDLTTFEIGLYFIIIPVCYAITAPLWGYIIDKKNGAVPLMLVSCVTCAVGFSMIGPTPLLPFLPRKIWLITLGMFVYGLLFNCTLLPTTKFFLIGATEMGFPDNISTFGLVAGLYNSTFYLGAFIGPTIGGSLQQSIGFEYASTVIAAMFVVWFIVLALFFTYHGKKTERGTATRDSQNHCR